MQLAPKTSALRTHEAGAKGDKSPRKQHEGERSKGMSSETMKRAPLEGHEAKATRPQRMKAEGRTAA